MKAKITVAIERLHEGEYWLHTALDDRELIKHYANQRVIEERFKTWCMS